MNEEEEYFSIEKDNERLRQKELEKKKNKLLAYRKVADYLLAGKICVWNKDTIFVCDIPPVAMDKVKVGLSYKNFNVWFANNVLNEKPVTVYLNEYTKDGSKTTFLPYTERTIKPKQRKPSMKYQRPTGNPEAISKVNTNFDKIEKLAKELSGLEKETEDLIEQNNLQSMFPPVEVEEEETATVRKPRTINIKIHFLTMGKLLKTPFASQKFFDEVKKTIPELTQEDYDKAIKYYTDKGWLKQEKIGSGKNSNFVWSKE
jgi:hypothetical protein